MDSGGIAANYIESIGATKEQGGWITQVRDNLNGKQFTIVAEYTDDKPFPSSINLR